MHRPDKFLLAAAAVLFACAALAEVTLKPKTVQHDAFTVVGISVRTNNAREATPNGAIPQQWQRFFQEGLMQKIPNRADENLYAVYTDYAGTDMNTDYTYIVGEKVQTAGGKLPEGMVAVTIPAGKYQMFTTAKGPLQEIMPAIWKGIWTYYGNPANGQRTFKSDFEVYDQRAADPNDAQVDVYIGVK